jgi:hypothetical protein
VVDLLVYFHHEDCSLAVDVRRPFSEVDKRLVREMQLFRQNKGVKSAISF